MQGFILAATFPIMGVTGVTIGIDVGCKSVKAVAVREDGTVVGRVRRQHRLMAEHAGELANDAADAWHDGVREVVVQLLAGGDLEVAGVQVAAMVPSMCAVGEDGRPISAGLLYGDVRGAVGDEEIIDLSSAESGELVRFLGHLVRTHPEAAGYWPAQAVANYALSGVGAIDLVTATTSVPLFDQSSWSPTVALSAGLDDLAKLPPIHPGNTPIGEVAIAGGAPLGPGTLDAYGELLVAHVVNPGDVLVILGSTLVVWAVIDRWVEVDGLWTVPHAVRGKALIGGPSNAGGLFVNWASNLIADWGAAAPLEADRVPVWQPYLWGERVPLHDPARRASLHDLDIGMGAAAARRAAYEASGFAIRHQLDLAGLHPDRLVATGGGVHNQDWVQAIADATRIPVDVVEVPEGAALGAAYLARVTAGLERNTEGVSRWSGTARRVRQNLEWVMPTEGRYHRYRGLVGC